MVNYLTQIFICFIATKFNGKLLNRHEKIRNRIADVMPYRNQLLCTAINQ